MLQVVDVSFKYNGLPILDGVATQVEKGSMVSVVGPNGAGKSTLLKCIARILTPAAGAVMVDGRDAASMTRRELARHIAYVPQGLSARVPATVFETILAGRSPYVVWRPSRADIERTAAIIASLRLNDLAMRDIAQLSGGQLQKVLVARALAQECPYLLL